LLEVVGRDLVVPVLPDGTAPFVHLDYAASAPALQSVADAVADFLPWYASVHRGAGFTSAVSSEALAAARTTVAGFVGARADDVVVFTRNTTDALNLIARSVPAGTQVLTLDLEHHANLLPWRNGTVTHLPAPGSAGEIAAVFDAALADLDGAPAVVAITGASNVTGEIVPIAAISAVARRHGARVVLDAAQLAPHRGIDVDALGVDYLAFSGHKLYAPFGAGVLVGRRDWLDAAEPYLAGGGAVRGVTLDAVDLQPAPARHEGGTPNVLGAVAIAAACRALTEIGLDEVAAHDAALLEQLLIGLDPLPVDVLSAFDDADRLGIVTLVCDRPADEVAAALSAEHGVATRDGAFCAHPLMRRLAGVAETAPVPSAVRFSFGVGTTPGDIDAALVALTEVLQRGPRQCYAVSDGRLGPALDERPRPVFAGLPGTRPAAVGAGVSCAATAT
jgi:selenocysteine lyase/cysteine desulfurase